MERARKCLTAWKPSIIACVAAFALTTAVASNESTVYAGPTRAIDDSFFGMHIHRAATGTAWPEVRITEWRLWDAGVSWPQLEPKRGKWNFQLLDAYVRIAADRHVEILLTLGLTPQWASARPRETSAYGSGNAAEPRNIADWQEYVQVVATRYKGLIHNYEIWNEPNVKGSYSGSAARMLELARVAYGVLKAADRSNTVVSPPATTQQGVSWLDAYLETGGCNYADVIGYHFYVTPGPPESAIPLVRSVKQVTQQRGCWNKPVWNTESGWAEPKHFSSDEEAAGYMMRTYLLNWLLGIHRCYWYAWDNHNWSTLDLTSREDNQITHAGEAYGVLRQWLNGTVLASCTRDRLGLWTCELTKGAGRARILWSDGDTQSFDIPSLWGVRVVTQWNGKASAAVRALRVGPAPVLLAQ